MKDCWDFVVVGAGVAGSFFAGLAAKYGSRVLLIDQGKFPRHKTCGGCLGPRGFRLLREAGALEGFEQFVPISEARFREPGGAEVSVPLDRNPANPTVSVSRHALDHHLVKWAIGCGVSVQEETTGLNSTVISEEGHSPIRSLLVRRNRVEELLHTRFLIVACGVGSLLVKRLGIKSRNSRPMRIGASWILPNRAINSLDPYSINMLTTRRGYLGIVGLPSGEWNCSASMWAGNPQAFFREVALQYQLDIEEEFLNATPTISHPLRYSPSALGGEQFLLIGDSAGYSEPITGEGMSWALESVIVALASLQQSPEKAHQVYEKNWRRIQKHRSRVPLTLTSLTSRPLSIKLASALQRCSLFPEKLILQHLHHSPKLEPLK